MTDVLSTKASLSTPKLYGRKWKVSVLIPNSETSKEPTYTAHVLSDSDKEETSLHVVFNIQKHGWVVPNFSEISVYNLAPDLENLIIKQGMLVRVEAGYVNGAYGIIYEAPIFQPMWARENSVSSKLTLRCIDAQSVIYQNHVATVGVLKHQKDMILDMSSRSRKPFELKEENMSEDLVDNQLVKPKVFFDEPIYYMRKYAQQSGTLPSLIDLDAYITKPQDPVSESALTNALVVSPGKGGLIGVPQQTQDGVSFTCLLNPMINIFRTKKDKKARCMLIKLENSSIKQAALVPMQESYSRLDKNYVYKVIGVTHVGDTRGNNWYSQVIGIDQSESGLLGALWRTQNDVNT